MSSAIQMAQLGIDIGGTKAALAVGREGKLIAQERFEDWSRGHWREDLGELMARGKALLAKAGVESGALAAVGVTSPGPLDIPNGTIVAAHNIPGWVQVPIVEKLREGFGVPVALDNDANAAALAEWIYGAGQGTQSMLFLTMSTGIGGGLVLGGRLHRGASFQAGEVGHMPIVLNGRLCTCGLRGCLEAYTGGHAIAAIMREEIAAGAQTSMLNSVNGDLEQLDARVWVDAIRSGDAYALDVRERFLDRTAQGIATLITTLDPECVVLGTIIQLNPDLFLDALRERVRKFTWPAFHHVRLEPGLLGWNLPFYAGLCAAALALEQASGSR